MKYTKGKWISLGKTKTQIRIVSKNNIHEVLCYINENIEEAEANAILISEAPETKAKLQRVEAQRDELLALAHSIVNGILAQNEILHNAKKLIKSITNQ